MDVIAGHVAGQILVLEFIGSNMPVFTPYHDSKRRLPVLAEVAVIDMGAIVTYVQTYAGGQQ